MSEKLYWIPNITKPFYWNAGLDVDENGETYRLYVPDGKFVSSNSKEAKEHRKGGKKPEPKSVRVYGVQK